MLDCHYHSQGVAAEKPFVKNKMAQIFALVFVVDYPLKVRHYACTDMHCVGATR